MTQFKTKKTIPHPTYDITVMLQENHFGVYIKKVGVSCIAYDTVEKAAETYEKAETWILENLDAIVNNMRNTP